MRMRQLTGSQKMSCERR